MCTVRSRIKMCLFWLSILWSVGLGLHCTGSAGLSDAEQQRVSQERRVSTEPKELKEGSAEIQEPSVVESVLSDASSWDVRGPDRQAPDLNVSDVYNTPENVVNDTKPTIPSEPTLNIKELFVRLPTAGRIPVTLHPGKTVHVGQSVVISFGVPFPRGVVYDIGQIKVTDTQGLELASNVSELIRWRTLGNTSKPTSLRAVLVSIRVTFKQIKTQSIWVLYGRKAHKKLNVQGTPMSRWISIQKSIYPDEYPKQDAIQEPAVYATLPARWLGACLLRTRSTVVGYNAAWKWFDDFFESSGRTAVNRVDPKVKSSEKIKYSSVAAPWLFDRALTLFGIYIRTGKVEWLRHAHRAAQFYARHINAKGFFDLKSGSDLKYSYGQSLLIALMLTGDTRLLAPIERIAAAGKTWNGAYTLKTSFWTERHQTYALLAALSAWEATGKKQYAVRVRTLFQVSYSVFTRPASSQWPKDGCMLHLFRAHEGFERTQHPICSPWMSALFADAVMRYYIHSEDINALKMLAQLGGYVRKYALYVAPTQKFKFSLPYYLASSLYVSPQNPWVDMEHTCDVGGLLARAVWATKKLGQPTQDLRTITEDVLKGCTYNLKYWHRPSGPSAGKPEWRLAPPRKFNWWFGTTHDLEWLMLSSQ